MAQKKILIYSTPTCPFCHQTKDYLSEKKIAFTDFDVASDSAKAQEMIDKSGQMGVPVLDIEGKIIVGFDKAAIDKEFGL
ncbi:MAG: glutathione S-transferase N-terminal domain-containing protein [Candidatus Parcubacteria bacterium]|nr:glutathione S-transferase N-terminal domain-containing protein [Candidatus Parcubacteria bacterium]